MPPLYRIAEVALYSILNFLPFLALALYPFRNKLRFSKPVILAMVAVLSLIQVFIGICAAFFPHGLVPLISAISTVIYAGFYFFAVKMPFGKTLFTLLMLSNNANMIVMISKCLEGRFFHELAIQPYRWSFSLMMIAVELVMLVPLFFYIKRYYTPAVEIEPSGKEWLYLWLIPATFYLIWFYDIYAINEKTSLEIALQAKNAIFFFFINLGAFLVYIVISKLVIEQKRNILLEEKNHRLVLLSVQYENLQERIAGAKKAKHDVRHHITLMKEYLKNHEYEELNKYLNSYQKSLPDDSLFSFCENNAVNAILLYFAQQSKNNGIDFIAKFNCPNGINIQESDLSVLLGNLLENALDAGTNDHKSDNRRIIIRGLADNSSLCFTVDNSFFGEIKKTADGDFLSTKHKGRGIGIESVREIVNRYSGTLQIKQQQGMFCVSVFLNLK